MACSCSKKGMRNTMSPRAGLARAAVVSPRTSIAPASTPSTGLRSLSSNAPAPERSPAGMTAERRKVEKNRRDAIRKALGK